MAKTKKKQVVNNEIAISDDVFEALIKEIRVNKNNFDIGKIKYMQWCEMDDVLLEKYGVSRRRFIFALHKRVGTHNNEGKAKSV